MHRAISWIFNIRLLNIEIVKIYWKISIVDRMPCGINEMYHSRPQCING